MQPEGIEWVSCWEGQAYGGPRKRTLYLGNISVTMCWGPSKSSWSLSAADDLAKRSRTTGVSPLISLRTQRMNLRNNSLQKWRDVVYTADTKPSPNRMSMPYPRPNREPPYWLSLPRNLQARACQLMSVLQFSLFSLLSLRHHAYSLLTDRLCCPLSSIYCYMQS